MRWQHPERGMVPPGLFIPHAERTGLMHRLTRHVLQAALQDRDAWLAEGLSLDVAVNISVSLLDRDLPGEVRSLLAQHHCDPEAVTLEITEDTVMADPDLATEVLGMLAQLGVRLSIDDFGTGYSSLAYLKNLPVCEIKIDRAFVGNLTEQADDAMIVRSTVDLGHNLGLEVVAEGVEDEATWNALRVARLRVRAGLLHVEADPGRGDRPLRARALVARACAAGWARAPARDARR